MINIIILAMLSCIWTYLIVATFLVLKEWKKYRERYEKDNLEKEVMRSTSSQIQDDIVHYCINNGLECFLMPDNDDITTLYCRDDKDNMTAICNIPQTEFDRGTPEYNAIFLSVCKEIDKYVGEQNDKNK